MSAPELSPEERATVDRFEAAPEPPEILRERVAAALWEGQEWYYVCPWSEVGAQSRANFLHLTDAAIAVLSGPSSDADAALERVRALAEYHATCCEFVAVRDLRRALAGD